jgi:hypothetical protein
MTGESRDGGAFAVDAPPQAHAPIFGDTRIELDREACLAMLDRTRIGRIGVSVGALPAIVPVDFVVVGETVAFPAEDPSAVQGSVDGVVLAFEVDGQSATGALDWTVMVRGISREVDTLPELAQFQTKWTLRQPTCAVPTRFIAVPTTIISGHRLRDGGLTR